jgi:hypothetical protein
MKMPFGDTGKSRWRGRVVLLACLNCVQTVAPDWPLLILWPCIKMSFASSMMISAPFAPTLFLAYFFSLIFRMMTAGSHRKTA